MAECVRPASQSASGQLGEYSPLADECGENEGMYAFAWAESQSGMSRCMEKGARAVSSRTLGYGNIAVMFESGFKQGFF